MNKSFNRQKGQIVTYDELRDSKVDNKSVISDHAVTVDPVWLRAVQNVSRSGTRNRVVTPEDMRVAALELAMEQDTLTGGNHGDE